MNSRTNADFEACIDAVYATLTDASLLPAALARVGHLVDASMSYIRVGPRGDIESVITHGFDPAVQQAYVDHYGMLDPCKQPVECLPVGVWFEDDSVLDPARTTSPEYVVDFAPQAGVRWFRGAKLHADAQGAAFISAIRPHDARPFNSEVSALLVPLHPHLARVSRLRAEVDKLLPARAASQAAVQALSAGVCLVDASLRLVFANRSALDLLRGIGPLQLHRDHLTGASLPVHSQLKRAVELATRAPRQARSFCPNPDDVLWMRLQVRVLPLDEGALLTPSAGGPFALLFVTRGTRTLHDDELAQLFGLTPSEAELVRLLAQGLTPSICADRRNVGISTVRSQLKSIYAKTGVNSVGQLMTLTLALPGLVPTRPR